MNEFLKVEGSDSLVRDINTGAIINCNVSEFEIHRKKLEASSRIKMQIETQEHEIKQIKDDIKEIKDLLMLLLSNK
jgi:hypothetical protein